MAGVLAVSCAKNDLMSGLDDHNAEEICFSMAPVRAVTRAATGFSNFPTVQPLCKPRARKNGFAALIFFEPCANHRHARMALVMLGGHCVWLTPISRGRVSHSDSGLNTVGGVLACPWFVNDWHSLRIMTLSDVEKISCTNR